MVEGTFALTVSIALDNCHQYRVNTHGVRQVDRVLNDIDLVIERRRDIDCRIGDDQRIWMVWHIS